MKHVKKILAWMLVFCMALSTASTTVFAAEITTDENMLSADVEPVGDETGEGAVESNGQVSEEAPSAADTDTLAEGVPV